MGNVRFSTWIALGVALVAVAGSIWLSVGMNLIACPLCFYQRAFAMGVLGVLVMTVLSPGLARFAPAVAAMPMALAGAFVALFHSNLVWTGKLECPEGVLGLGTAPEQSLAVFGLIILALAWDTGSFVRQREAQSGAPQQPPPPGGILAVALAPLVLGLAFAAGCIWASPKPKAPDGPYKNNVPDTCRVPYRPAN